MHLLPAPVLEQLLTVWFLEVPSLFPPLRCQWSACFSCVQIFELLVLNSDSLRMDWIKGLVTVTELENSCSVCSGGIPMPSPPNFVGRLKSLLSTSLVLLSNDGGNYSVVDHIFNGL